MTDKPSERENLRETARRVAQERENGVPPYVVTPTPRKPPWRALFEQVFRDAGMIVSDAELMRLVAAANEATHPGPHCAGCAWWGEW